MKIQTDLAAAQKNAADLDAMTKALPGEIAKAKAAVDALTKEVQAAAALANARHLLVIVDYDGTLAPIVEHPSLARPNRSTLAVLKRLASAPDTTVAVVSGRRRVDLEDFVSVDGVDLVGGHGAESDDAPELEQEVRELLDQVRTDLEEIAEANQGVLLEVKPTSIAMHYRQVEGAGEEIVAQVMTGPARRSGVRVLAGKRVVELSVSRRDKGDAVRQLRERHLAGTVCFIGDDLTDEDAFRVLLEGDVGVKVGEGETSAVMRLESQADVVPFLEELAAARERHL